MITICTIIVSSLKDHRPYITSEKRWVGSENGHLYWCSILCVCWQCVGRSEKVQKYADVIGMVPYGPYYRAISSFHDNEGLQNWFPCAYLIKENLVEFMWYKYELLSFRKSDLILTLVICFSDRIGIPNGIL